MRKSRTRALAMAIGMAMAAGCGSSGGATDTTLPDLPDAMPDVPVDVPSDLPPVDVPGELSSADVPADVPPDLPSDLPGDAPSDLPGDPGVVPTPFGAACTAESGCEDFFCATTEIHETFVGGYCTSPCDPSDDASCGDGAACFDADMGIPLCVKVCATDADCRPPETVCAGSCVPGGFVAVPPPADPLPSTDANVTAFLGAFDSDRLLRRVRELSGADPLQAGDPSSTLASRAVGSPQHLVAAAWLADRMADGGADVLTLPFDMPGDGHAVPGRNLVAEIPGLRSDLPPLVVAAHWDSTASATPGWDAATGPAPGANDDASGVAIALEVLSILATPGVPQPARSIRVILFDGEERGLVGSKIYVSNLDPYSDSLACVLNVDMVGGAMPAMNGRFWYQWAGPSDPAGFAALGLSAIATFAPTARPVATDFDTGGGSDTQSFWDDGHCAVGMFAWPRQVTNHTIGDTIDTIQPAFYESATRAALAVVAAWAWHVDGME